MKKFKIERFLKIKELRRFLMKRRLKSCGQNVVFCSGIKLHVPKNISIGNNAWIGEKSRFSGAGGGISMGNNVILGPEVTIWSSNHNYYSPEMLPYDNAIIPKKVIIEDNVWICCRACIAPGVTIGEGAVVGMGAVVTTDVPPGAVVGGNPAKVLKYRDIEKYNQLKRENKFKQHSGYVLREKSRNLNAK